MKKFAVIGLAIFAVSCAPSNTQNPWANLGVKVLEADGSLSTNFQRDSGDLHIVIDPQTTRYGIGIKNNGTENAFVIWDESTIVYGSGKTTGVMHNGVKYIDRNNTQKPSVIPAGAYVTDDVVATDKVEWIDGNRYVAGRWVEYPFYAPVDGSKATLNLVVQDSKGKRTEKFTTVVVEKK